MTMARAAAALTLLVAAGFTPIPEAHAAPRKCKPFMVNVRAGTVNGLGPATPMAKVRKKLPCFTAVSDEGAFYNNGGGVFYGSDNLYFYTYLRFIEIRAPFNGTTDVQIFGRPKAAVAMDFPFNAADKRPFWATPADEFATTKFGCIQFSFRDDNVRQMRFFTRPCEKVFNPD